MQASRAPVKPRFISRSTGDALSLEDSVLDAFRHFRQGVIEIAGPVGAGKTFALRHLAAVLPDDLDVAIFERGSLDNTQPVVSGSIIEVDSEDAPLPGRLVRFDLAPWGSDELIEYALAQHPEHCKSVVGRLLAAPDRDLLGGCPELCSLVLDRMAQDAEVDSVAEVLRDTINELTLARHTGRPLVKRLLLPDDDIQALERSETLSPETTRLLRHRTVRAVAAAMLMADLLERGDLETLLELDIAKHVIQRTQVIDLICDWTSIRGVECLKAALLRRDCASLHSLFATLLIRLDASWKPDIRVRPDLSGATLKLVDWPKADLRRFELNLSDLRGANLESALLIAAQATAVNLSSSCLRDARLRRIQASGANFQDADLREASGCHGEFGWALFCRANAKFSTFTHANFSEANLTEADFRDSSLRGALLRGAIMMDTNFTNADFTNAILTTTQLNEAILNCAVFEGAEMSGSVLESVNLSSGRFAGARLAGANMTGSTMPNADFRDASLVGAYLAEVDWPGADLRGAILTGATFHMGSSRSGLVDSVIASEGTRTGFYSNDFDEHLYHQPEEICAANLQGADLRGAKITGVDFYRVDLRGAKIDDDQREQMLATGAFLD